MDNFHLPTSPNSDIQTYLGGSNLVGQHWHIWKKPRGKSMVRIILHGAGGGGGTGVIGANSVSAGGGGGGSGAMTTVLIPAEYLPDTLYISLGNPSTGAGIASIVAIYPSILAGYAVAYAAGGGGGGNGSAGTGGAAGAAGTAAGQTTMPLGWGFGFSVAGSTGIAGGGSGAGAALTLPLTGNLAVAGTGGGGLPAAGVAGTAGGAYTVPAGGVYPAWAGGVGGAAGTTPPGRGQDGIQNFLFGMKYAYGGTGGGSTHGTATGAGLVQAAGGDGINPGCGGGGMGGALTGSTPAVASKGGPGWCQIVSF